MKRVALVMFMLCALQACSWTPLQLCAWEEMQMCEEQTPVIGARLGLISHNDSVDAIDIGVLAAISQQSSGIAVAPFVMSDEHTGLQLALVTHAPNVDGVSIALYNNMLTWVGTGAGGRNTINGAQLGLWSYSDALNGVQLSPVNAAGTVCGVQIGVVNAAKRDLQGVQLGLFNTAKGGFQIGLLNWNENGFLPFFPLFNF